MADEEKVVQEFEIGGADKAVSDLNRIGDAGADAINKISQASGDLDKTAKGLDDVASKGKDLEAVGKAAYAFGGAIRDTSDAVTELVKNFSAFGRDVAAGIGAAGTALGGLVKKAANATDAVRDAAIQAGTLSKNLQTVAFAADQSGSSLGGVQRALGLINAGGGDLEKKLAKFNVRLRQSNGDARDSTDVFKDFADAIAGIDDPTQRAAAAAEVFGRRVGPQLVETLSLGRKGIEDLGKEAERLGLIFSGDELRIGDEFNDSLSKLTQGISAAVTRLALAFGPGLTKLFDTLAKAIEQLQPAINQVVQTVGPAFTSAITAITDALGPLGTLAVVAGIGILSIGKAVTVVGTLLGPFGTLLGAVFNPFARLLPTIASGLSVVARSVGLVSTAIRLLGIAATVAFGPWGIAIAAIGFALGALAVYIAQNFTWSEFTAAVSTAWNGLLDFIKRGLQAITDFATYIAGLPESAWQVLSDGAEAAFTTISEAATGLWDSITEAFDAGVQFFADLWESIKQGATDAWDFLKTAFENGVSAATDFLQPLIDTINQLWDLLKKVGEALTGAGSGGGGGDLPQFKAGGMIRGPGTGTSDSILARVSNREFIMKRKATDYYGPGFMNALNNLKIPLKAIRGFAAGGMVGDMSQALRRGIPAFAEGGMVHAGGGGRPVNLNIGGERFELMAPDDNTADRLTQFSIKSQVRSTGRKPTSFRGNR